MNKQHKYEVLEEHLKNQILRGDIGFGDKIPSENELAALFSLSRFTVRRAIELLTNEGFLEKRHGSGTYVRSPGPGRVRTGRVGIVTTYLDDYIFPGIIKGIEDMLSPQKFTMSLGITRNNTEKEAACLRAMLEQDVDGMILEATKSAYPNPNIGLLEELRARHIPIVFINGNYPEFDGSCVLMDDEGSGAMAARYLIDNGHARIGAIFKSDDMQGHKRHEGFLRECGHSGLRADDCPVLWYTTEDLGGLFSRENEADFLRRFSGCTAILCYNDQIAVKTVDLLERGGRPVPQSVSVIGFDNSDLCEMASVKLTSVTHAHQHMGELAAQTLLSVILAGRSATAERILLPSQIVARDSVKNLRLT